MSEPVRNIRDQFVPQWFERLWHKKVVQQYTGPVTLHFREGRVLKIEERLTTEPQDYKA